MKIAVIVPIGYVDRWGYQRFPYECISSFSSCTAMTILTEQYRNAPGVSELAERLGAMLLSDARTWYDLDDDGQEIVDWQRVNDGENVALDAAREAGCDTAIMVSSNWYATAKAWEYIERLSFLVCQANEPYIRFPVRYQLGRVLFHCDLLASGILNLAHGWYFKEAYCVTDGVDGAPDQTGDFRQYDDCALVDVALDVTVDELRDKMNARKCEHLWLPKRNPVFEWDYWRGHYVGKFGKKKPSQDKPQGIGAMIAAAAQPDFVSSIVLGELGYGKEA